MSKANQNSAMHSVSKSYFTNIVVQHINQAFVYIMDCNLPLNTVYINEFLENEIQNYVMKYP